jgi:hypothetical protein
MPPLERDSRKTSALLAPILLILGVATRSAAAAIAFTMFMPVFLLHTDDVFALGDYARETHVFFALGAIIAAHLGSGRFAGPVKGRWAKRMYRLGALMRRLGAPSTTSSRNHHSAGGFHR